MAIISQNLINRKLTTQGSLLIEEQETVTPQVQKPTLQWINPNRLKIDPSYQRITLSESTIKKIVRDFNWSAFGTITVMERDGVFYVPDGNHRRTAAIRMGLTSVPCSVTKSEGIFSEARIFNYVNINRNNPTSYNKWNSLLAQGIPTYVKCEAMLDLLHLRVKQDASPKVIAFPAGLIRTFEMDPKACEYSLIFQRAMIGEKEQLSEAIHKGLFSIMREVLVTTGSMVNLEHAYRVYGSGGKAFVMNAIKSIQFKQGVRDLSIIVCAMGVCNALNQGLKRNKIQYRGLEAE